MPLPVLAHTAECSFAQELEVCLPGTVVLSPAQCLIYLYRSSYGNSWANRGLFWGIFASSETGRGCWTIDYFRALKSAQFGMQLSLSEYCCFLALAKLVQAKGVHREDMSNPILLSGKYCIYTGENWSLQRQESITEEYRATSQLHFNPSLILEAGCQAILPSRGNTLRHNVLKK